MSKFPLRSSLLIFTASQRSFVFAADASTHRLPIDLGTQSPCLSRLSRLSRHRVDCGAQRTPLVHDGQHDGRNVDRLSPSPGVSTAGPQGARLTRTM